MRAAVRYLLTIDMAPVAIGRPKVNTFTGQAYYDPNTIEVKDYVFNKTKERLLDEGVYKCIFPRHTPVKVTAIFYRERPERPKNKSKPVTRPDTDNYVKILDSFNRLVYFDDGQVTTILVKKRFGQPRMEFIFEDDADD